MGSPSSCIVPEKSIPINRTGKATTELQQSNKSTPEDSLGRIPAQNDFSTLYVTFSCYCSLVSDGL